MWRPAAIISFILAVTHNSVAPNWPKLKKSKEIPCGPLQLEVNQYRVFHNPTLPPQIFSLEIGQQTFVVLDLERKKVIGIVHDSPHIARLAIPKSNDYVSVEIDIKDNQAKRESTTEVSDDVPPNEQFNGKPWGQFIRKAVIVPTTNGGQNGAGTSSNQRRRLGME